ncbi:MAG: YciI family protein [Candidatus Eremiobacteraeota bacterium]|nr:YciI family protein [Candidatus Eremiobacteraeota bacterium]
MKYFALLYDVVDDYVERRAAFRDEHLGLGREAVARGEIVLGGAFSDPADTAPIVFRCEDASTAENFARNDPYVKNGLVKQWRARPWNVVTGTAHSE